MNDRINILAEQSGFYVSESRLEILAPDSSTDNVTEALREFAESIVRECINATGNCAGTGDLIKEHFGVK
jgi:hypothetical protein